MASLNLPAALEDASGELLPQSLVDKSQQVCNLGGIKQLENMIKELPELLQRNKDILDEVNIYKFLYYYLKIINVYYNWKNIYKFCQFLNSIIEF